MNIEKRLTKQGDKQAHTIHHKFHILALLKIPTKTIQPPVQKSTDLPTKIPYVIEQPIFKIHPANLFIHHKFHTLALLKIPTKTT